MNNKIFFEILKSKYPVLYHNVIIKKEKGVTVFYVPNYYCMELLYKDIDKIISEYDKLSKIKFDNLNFRVEINSNLFVDKDNIRDKQRKPVLNFLSNLNSSYTFSNYIVGSPNEMAYVISQSIISGKIKSGIFYIQGKPSSGKTHLISAIANYFKNITNTAYLTSDTFIVNALGKGEQNIQDFKEYLSKFNVVCLDDLQNINRLKNTVLENVLFVLLDNFSVSRDKIFIISSDIPVEMLDFELRIKERLQSKYFATIEYPDIKMKKEYVNRLLKVENVKLADKQIKILVEACQTFRRISVVINYLLFCIKELGISVKDAFDASIQKFIETENKEEKRKGKLGKWGDIISRHFKLKNNFYKVKYIRKNTELYKAFCIYLYISREILGMSYPEISKECGKHEVSLKNLMKEMKQNKKLMKDIKSFIKKHKTSG